MPLCDVAKSAPFRIWFVFVLVSCPVVVSMYRIRWSSLQSRWRKWVVALSFQYSGVFVFYSMGRVLSVGFLFTVPQASPSLCRPRCSSYRSITTSTSPSPGEYGWPRCSTLSFRLTALDLNVINSLAWRSTPKQAGTGLSRRLPGNVDATDALVLSLCTLPDCLRKVSPPSVLKQRDLFINISVVDCSTGTQQ